MPQNKTLILEHNQVQQKINRIAWQVYENCFEEDDIVIVGVAERGIIIAKRIKAILEDISPLKASLVELKIDKGSPAQSQIKLLPEDKNSFSGKTVVLIDDVLNTGKTLIYGVKYLLNFPLKRLITVVLVDRKHRLFPVKADLVGLTLATTMQEHIYVEIGKGEDAVYLA